MKKYIYGARTGVYVAEMNVEKCTVEFMCVMISKISSSSDSQAGCMQILSKDGEMEGREERVCGGGVPL